jgi:hypothetical protein
MGSFDLDQQEPRISPNHSPSSAAFCSVFGTRYPLFVFIATEPEFSQIRMASESNPPDSEQEAARQAALKTKGVVAASGEPAAVLDRFRLGAVLRGAGGLV